MRCRAAVGELMRCQVGSTTLPQQLRFITVRCGFCLSRGFDFILDDFLFPFSLSLLVHSVVFRCHCDPCQSSCSLSGSHLPSTGSFQRLEKNRSVIFSGDEEVTSNPFSTQHESDSGSGWIWEKARGLLLILRKWKWYWVPAQRLCDPDRTRCPHSSRGISVKEIDHKRLPVPCDLNIPALGLFEKRYPPRDSWGVILSWKHDPNTLRKLKMSHTSTKSSS